MEDGKEVKVKVLFVKKETYVTFEKWVIREVSFRHDNMESETGSTFVDLQLCNPSVNRPV